MEGAFDRIAERYDETRGYPPEVMTRIFDAVEAALRPSGTVLDAGIGTGRFAKPLQERGLDIVGVDISRKMLDVAARKGTNGLVRGDACKLPFKDKSFERALSIHVMHLIPTWGRALGEIARVTERELVSIAFDRSGSQAEAVKESYEEACERRGWRVRHPGVRERELSDLLAPRKRELVARHQQAMDVKKMLGDYESRTYSSQWNVPDQIHLKVLEDLRKRYEGASMVMSEEDILLLVWDVEDLKEFALSCE